MSVSYVGAGSLTRVSGGGNPNVYYPAGLADGDLILAIISRNGPLLTAPDDSWTRLTTVGSLEVWSKSWSSAVGDAHAEFVGNTMIYESQSFAYRGLNDAPTATAAVHGNSAMITPPTSGVNAGLLTVASPVNVLPQVTPESPAVLWASETGYQKNDGRTTTNGFILAGFLPAFTRTRGPILNLSSSVSWDAATVVLPGNLPPNAPEITTPTVNAIIDRTSSTRFTAPFSDPNPGDSQSALDFRYWALDSTGARVGAATVVNLKTPYQYWDSPPSTFADTTKYEIQAQSYDALGTPSGWGPSTFFTAQTPPPGPTITAPINGASVPETITVEWSTPNQDSWQVQVLDAAAAVVQDTGEVVGAARSTDVTFAVNDVTRVIQQRSKYQGLWSPWASVTVTVSYTPPPTPALTLSPDNAAGATVLAIDNPPPGAGEPSVSYVDVYCRTAAGSALVDDYRPYSEAGVRLATWQPPGSLWSDPTPASVPVVYEYRVVAVGTNGTTASSAWVSTATSEPGTARAGTYGGY